MDNEKDNKVNRILTIYSKLAQGVVVNKKELAKLFNVNEKTIQRDIDDIRAYFSDNRYSIGAKDIVFRRDKKGYILDNRDDILTKEGTLAISKILLESRAFCKSELIHLTNSILGQVDVEQRKCVKDIIGNELLNYVPLKHSDFLLSKIWSLSELVRSKELTQITYIKNNSVEVERIIKPVAIIFSEYYFYLIAYSKDFDSPTVFRVDKIKEHKSLNERFYIPDSERFEDGEFRKRVQFMYPGKLMKIKFEFIGTSIEAVLDRLPTARINKTLEGRFVVEAEVFGTGIIMWILSQGKKIKVLQPTELVEQIVCETKEIQNTYK